MIAERIRGDRATLHEFALYFIRNVSAIYEEDEQQAAAGVLGAILTRNLEIRTVTLLGKGAFGAAGGHRNHVLKITSDATEPLAAWQLLGKKLRHVVRFYEAATIEGFTIVRDLGEGGEVPVGIVLSEKLDSVGLEDGQDDTLSRVVSETKKEFGIFDLNWDDFTTEEARDAIKDAAIALEERLFADFSGAIREIALGLEELRSHDVYVIDVHAKNVGYDRDEGVHKIFDVGLASSPLANVPGIRGRRNR